MKDLKYRKDNQGLLLWAYFLFIGLILFNLIINIMNTKNVFFMYLITLVMGVSIISYIFFYLIYKKIKKEKLILEDNYLAFYVSFNKNNKKLKVTTLFIDSIELITLLVASYYYMFKMDFINVYNFYPLFGTLALFLITSIIILMDVSKIKALDRIDYYSSNEMSMLDRKLLFCLNILFICISNIGILSYKTPHFIVYYKDLVAYTIISSAYLLISLTSIFIKRYYYKSFEIKQIEHKETNINNLEQIGQGKYATVYKAYVSSLDTVYAVKKLESNDVKDIERFKSEFNIMKALEHQNLLRVYSFDEIHYEYVMDYCKYNLENYITNNDISKDIKKDLTLQLLNSFAYLHSHNIMHRDISKRNIMLKENEETHELTLKVMDFGIAKNNNAIKKTRTETDIKGTLIDPALDDFSRYTEQNDIYGLGIMINYINYRTETIIQDGTDVSKIVNRCMDLNLTSRYHHVNEIITDYMEASI